MTDYKPLACSDYDVLELVCMEHYRVELTTDSGLLVCAPLDLQVRSSEEHLIVRLDNGEQERIRLDRIRRVVVLTRPARLTEHSFAITSKED